MIFPLFRLKNGAFRGNLAYFIKYAFLYTSIDIIKELPVIYNISITKYEKNGNFSFRIRRICVFSDITWLPAEARGSRKAIETIVFSELLTACQHKLSWSTIEPPIRCDRLMRLPYPFGELIHSSFSLLDDYRLLFYTWQHFSSLPGKKDGCKHVQKIAQWRRVTVNRIRTDSRSCIAAIIALKKERLRSVYDHGSTPSFTKRIF